MRWSTVLLFLSFLVCALAWTKEDHEIFDLVESLVSAEGKGTTFYNFLDVSPSASGSEIGKAYRKRSLELHPDKNPGVADIQARFARLGVIAGILRNAEKRERYDFFHKNGVPVWRGTGYYYARFRPSLSLVVLLLVAFTAFIQYLVLSLNHRRDLARIEYFRSSALKAAGVSVPGLGLGRAGSVPVAAEGVLDKVAAQVGEVGVVKGKKEGRKEREARERGEKIAAAKAMRGEGKRRKVKVPLVEGAEGKAGSLELVVVEGEVYIPEGKTVLTPISSLAKTPTFQSLWPTTLVKSIFTTIDQKFISKTAPASSPAPASPVTPTEKPAPAPKKAVVAKKDGEESDISDFEEVEGTDGEVPSGSGAGSGTGGEEAEKKKKKKGLGKAAGMRRMKMGGK